MKKTGLFTVILVVVLALTSCSSGNYQKAKELFDSGSYSEAMTLFEELGDYEDSASMITECKYQSALSLYKEGKYEEAISALEPFADRAEAVKAIQDCKYNLALKEYESCNDIESYQKVKELFTGFNGYKDSQNIVDDCDEKINETIYNNALALFEDKKYDEAVKTFAQVENYKDSKKYSTYMSALIAHNKKDYAKAVEEFEKVEDFLDSSEYLDSYIWYETNILREHPRYDDDEAVFSNYKFDDNGNLLSYSEKSLGGDYYDYSYEYDENNFLIKEINAGRYRTTTNVYMYDENGEIIHCTEITVHDNKTDTEEIEYDNEYDNYGNLVKQTKIRSNGSKTINEYSNGNLIRESFGVELKFNLIYTYDNNGMLIQHIEHFADNDYVYISKYVYDNYGNIIKRMVTQKYDNGVEEPSFTYTTKYAPMVSKKC